MSAERKAVPAAAPRPPSAVMSASDAKVATRLARSTADDIADSTTAEMLALMGEEHLERLRKRLVTNVEEWSAVVDKLLWRPLGDAPAGVTDASILAATTCELAVKRVEAEQQRRRDARVLVPKR